MNDKHEFIYMDENNEIIKKYSRYNDKAIIKEFNNCKKEIIINKLLLHYYEKPSAGIAHCISKLSTYLRLITKYEGNLIIPNNTNNNIFNLINNIFSNIIKLEKNIKYVLNKFIFSVYIELMDNPNLMKPDNRYPLIVYNNDIYWFRTYINKHIDFTMEKKPVYDKIFVGKFEGQGSSGEITKPRSLLGCVPLTLLKRFEKNGL